MGNVYNPVVVKIRMKKITNNDQTYYIGNCDMDVNLLDTVIKFYPPSTEHERIGSVLINNFKSREEEEDDML